MEGRKSDPLVVRAYTVKRYGAAGRCGGVQRACAVRALYLLGALHHLQVWLGTAGKRLVAGGGGRGVGYRARIVARANFEMDQSSSAGLPGADFIDSRLRDVGRRDAKLDDVRDYFCKPAGRYRHRYLPEHH